MCKVAIICEYDGTDFVGFQFQNNGRSVEGCLEEALSNLYKTNIDIQGCSRTDSGVHARGHVSSLDVPFIIPEDRLPAAINVFLPSDIAVKKAIYTNDEFNARFDSLGKRYIYRIYSDPIRQPLKDRYAYHVKQQLDIEAMQKASLAFAGEHDFKAFCAAGGSQVTTVRRIFSVNVFEKDGMIEIVVQGAAFLYNMVRIISGTLLEVGTGRIKAEDVAKIIASLDRSKAGRTLPAKGLTLEEVFYDWDKARDIQK